MTRERSFRRKMRHLRWSPIAVLVGAVSVLTSITVLAYWTVSVLYAPSNFAVAKAGSLSAPTAPTAVANSGSAITIGWTLPASQVSGAQYQVTRTAPGTATTVCTVAATVTSCQDTGLTAGTGYSYSIAAVLHSWQSSSISASATTIKVTTASLPAADANIAYSFTPIATGGSGGYTWALSGTLPTGLSFSTTTGAISGTPAATGTTTGLVLTATDSNGASASSGSLSLTVNAQPSVTTTSLATATQTESGYSQTLASSAGTAPITWSISSGSLPTGLSVAASTGVISGTVTNTATTQTFTVLATDANGGTGSKSLTITVNVPPSVTTTSLATATQGQSGYSQTLGSSGGTSPVTWSISSGTLPSGLSLSASTGVISGNVSTSATSQTITVRAIDANSVFGSKSLTLTVNTKPSVSTTSLSAATQTQTGYTETLAATSGVGPYTWSVGSGTLPTGLSLTGSTGVISGNVGAAATTQTFSVVATDSNGVASAGKSLTLTVNAAPLVTTSSLATATQTQAGYSQTLASSGGTSPVTWGLSSGSLPLGLSLASGTGVISGTVGGAATTQTFTVAVTDANGVAATKSLTINVNTPPSVTTTSLATATQTQTGYSQALASSGGTTPITWTVSTGSLPSGLNLAASTGVISGTVGSAATTQTFTVAATDANGVAGTHSLTITVNAAPSVTTTSLANATQGQSGYSQTLSSSGGTAPVTWSKTGTLPAGLTLSTSGVISGNVSATATTSTFTVTATDANGVAAGKSLTITVTAKPSVTTTTLAAATQTQSVYSQTLAASNGVSPYTWSIGTGSLPAGLSLNPATGAITGSVGAAATTQTFTVVATDSNGVASTGKSLSITVNTPPTVSTTSLPAGAQGASYSQTLAAANGTTPYAWSLGSGSLPAGLSLAPATGVISGTINATTGATQTFTVVATDSNGVASSGQSLTITVNPAPTVTSPTSASPCNPGHNGTGNCVITGTNFEVGVTVSISANGHVNSVTRNSSTQLTISVTGSGASGGKGNITVTNPDGGTATVASGFSNG